MKKLGLLIALLGIIVSGNSLAMEGMDHDQMGEKKDGGFVHTEMSGDLHSEFKVMDLASMNMKDPAGNTHHVMATFMRNHEKITQAVGKIKLIAPSGKEQLADLKDFGSGVFAANFKIDEPGKWGIICLFKESGGKHTVKFWYSHMPM